MIKLMTWALFMGLGIGCFAQTGTVTLEIEGILVDKGGQVSAGLFTEPHFPKIGQQTVSQFRQVTSTTMRLTFTQVPVGTYGVAVFQDINMDEVLETNFVGLPREPIGFSNQAPMNLGPPSFDKASISVRPNHTLVLRIILE